MRTELVEEANTIYEIDLDCIEKSGRKKADDNKSEEQEVESLGEEVDLWKVEEWDFTSYNGNPVHDGRNANAWFLVLFWLLARR